MNVVALFERARHPFLDGKTKRLLIDGKWVEAASAKTFASINPAIGEVLAQVAEGDREDIDRGGAMGGREATAFAAIVRLCVHGHGGMHGGPHWLVDILINRVSDWRIRFDSDAPLDRRIA